MDEIDEINDQMHQNIVEQQTRGGRPMSPRGGARGGF